MPLRNDSPLWWSQHDARARGDFLVPDRWTDLAIQQWRASPWSVLLLPAQCVLLFGILLSAALFPAGPEE